MWVLGGEALKRRLEMNPYLGLWFDYWLFLLADEAHPAWSVRPVGISTIAQLAPKYTHPRAHRAIRQQLQTELNVLLSEDLPKPQSFSMPSVAAHDEGKDTWSAEWMAWFKDTTSNPSFFVDLIRQLHDKLVTAIEAEEVGEILKYTRLLANELTSQGRLPRELLLRTIPRFFPESAAPSASEAESDHWQDLIREIVWPPHQVNFCVIVPTISNSISRRTKRLIEVSSDMELLYSSNDELAGIKYKITTFHASAAASEALRRAAHFFERLRVRFYVVVQISAHIRVVDPDEREISVPLPEPFWMPGPGRREVPTLPPGFKVPSLQESDRPRWLAARWHLSQAFARWREDVHAAAAEVWQALEAFVGQESAKAPLQRVKMVTSPYLQSVVADLLTTLAHKFSNQCNELRRLTGKRPWSYYSRGKRKSVDEWLAQVLGINDLNSKWCYHNWRPEPPLLPFHPQYGKFHELWQLLQTPSSCSWIKDRLDSDLTLLYGLRNAVIHEGDTSMCESLAEYLGQVGLEVLLKAMKAVKEQIDKQGSTVSIDSVLQV